MHGGFVGFLGFRVSGFWARSFYLVTRIPQTDTRNVHPGLFGGALTTLNTTLNPGPQTLHPNSHRGAAAEDRLAVCVAMASGGVLLCAEPPEPSIQR